MVAFAFGSACSSGNGAAKALVKAVNLRRLDVPPEWSESPRPDPVGEEGDDSRYSACIGRPDPKRVRTAGADSAEFHLDNRLRAMSSVQTMPGQGTAKADFVAQRGDRGLSCLRQRIRDQFNRAGAAGNTPGRFTVDRVSGLEVGEETVAFRAELTYPPINGDPHTGYVDVVHVRKGKVEIALTLFSDRQPFPDELERGLLTKMVSRASAHV